jgi:predicted AAA+ superfamily ATPase
LKSLSLVNSQKALDKLFDRRKNPQEAEFERYLATGGLPGIGFFRSDEIRSERWQSQIDSSPT